MFTKYYSQLLGFEVPVFDVLYAILAKLMIQYFFIFLLLVFLLVILDYLLVNFSSENNIYPIYNVQNYSSILDISFVLYLSIYIISMMFLSIGFIYHLLGDISYNQCEFNDIYVSLIASQWTWDAFCQFDNVDAYYFQNTHYHNQMNDQISLIHNHLYWASEQFLLLPQGVQVYIFGSSSDVIHSFGIPSAGVKFDCIPGRLQTFQVLFNQSGSFMATCYELCGAGHAYMRIGLEVVSLPLYIIYNQL